MNIDVFLNRIEEILPPAKQQNANQLVVYRAKLRRFSDSELDKLCEAVIENCRFWPKIADIYEQARGLGLFAKAQEYRPHVWEPTDCRMCGGSGLVATFWSQEFEETDEGRFEILRLHYMMPYHTSAKSHQQRDHDDVLAVNRCSCVAGNVVTLDKGIPKWDESKPTVRRRNWAA